MEKNIVSIIIPTYNCAEYLPNAIDSALRQTFKKFEIIIIDDGSLDNTKLIVHEYINNFSNKIKYFYQCNKGLPSARNLGINKSNSDYIALLDADDELYPESLERCTESIEAYKAEWCITDLFRIENGRKQIVHSNIPEDNLLPQILNNCIRQVFFFSKKAMLDIELYDEFFRVYEDWDLYIRLIEAKKKFVYIKEPLYIYKIRQQSLVKNNTKKCLFYTLKILEKHHKRIADRKNKWAADIYSKKMWDLARNYFYQLKDIKKTTYCIKESMKYGFNFTRLIHPLFFNLNRFVRKMS